MISRGMAAAVPFNVCANGSPAEWYGDVNGDEEDEFEVVADGVDRR
jgi:hypothetical protein